MPDPEGAGVRPRHPPVHPHRPHVARPPANRRRCSATGRARDPRPADRPRLRVPRHHLPGARLRRADAVGPRDVVEVFVPEYVVGRWWEQVLHNQSALRLKARLLFMPGVMVTCVPYQLGPPSSTPRGRRTDRASRGRGRLNAVRHGRDAAGAARRRRLSGDPAGWRRFAVRPRRSWRPGSPCAARAGATSWRWQRPAAPTCWRVVVVARSAGSGRRWPPRWPRSCWPTSSSPRRYGTLQVEAGPAWSTCVVFLGVAVTVGVIVEARRPGARRGGRAAAARRRC